MPSRKRVHQQQTIRKKKQDVEPKRRRISYLSNHLLTFNIIDGYRVTSKKTPLDCFICTLQYLSIIDELMADMLRTFVTGKGIHIDQMIAVLRLALKNEYQRITTETLQFNSIYQLFDLLEPSTATIIGMKTSSGLGHIVLLAKDINSNIGIIDPQIEKTCVRDECEEFIQPYRNHPILIFTHETL
jgi:hypothetical protein